ncbi:MAG: hypothetical protein V2A66_03500 [Pseudomonadota bacterium]
MKKIILSIAVLCLFAGEVFAAKTTYIITNKRFNYIKLKEVSGREVEARAMTHPATVDEQGLRAALASVQLSRTYLIKKEVDTQQVFDDWAIDFLSANLPRAFAKAGPNETVVFSYLSKNPVFIIRNDRLNIGQMWIHNDELHIKFEKLYAKVIGDIDRRGTEARAIAQAKSLRVKLDLGEGQKLGTDDPEEIVLDMHHNYAKKPESEAPPPPNVTMAGEKIEAPADQKAQAAATNEKTPKGKKAVKGSKAEQTAPAAVPQAAAPTGPKQRLEQLEYLKNKGLVNKKEYEEKRKEILKDL